jgi:hypothetical protein
MIARYVSISRDGRYGILEFCACIKFMLCIIASGWKSSASMKYLPSASGFDSRKPCLNILSKNCEASAIVAPSMVSLPRVVPRVSICYWKSKVLFATEATDDDAGSSALSGGWYSLNLYFGWRMRIVSPFGSMMVSILVEAMAFDTTG